MKSIKVRMKHLVAEQMMANKATPIVVNVEILAYTGAKLYYKGGGWWLISGYSADNNDVDRLIKEVLL